MNPIRALKYLKMIGLSAIACTIVLGGSLKLTSAPLDLYQTNAQVHPLPEALAAWLPQDNRSDYFPEIKPLPLGYLLWSDRPVSIYIGPSHFSDARRVAWEQGVQDAIADWQVYFPLEITTEPQADIVIQQARPKKTSQGRARSAQATPKAYCAGDRLAHRFTLEISPSQTGPYIKAATRHELGHALGLWGHSPDPLDVMYTSQVSDPPPISERDINTLKKIYAQPTLLGWPAPQYCPPRSSGRPLLSP